MLADARQVEHEDLLELHLDPVLEPGQVRVAGGMLGGAGQVVVEVAAPLDVHVLARQRGDRVRAGVAGARRGLDEGLVVVGPRVAVVIDRGQVRVVEDRGQLARPPARLELQPALAVQRPAAVPPLLVLVPARVPDARLGLDVVEVDVLGARPVGPDLLARHRAGVAADALVEVHHHRDLRHDPHQLPAAFRRVTAARLRISTAPPGSGGGSR